MRRSSTCARSRTRTAACRRRLRRGLASHPMSRRPASNPADVAMRDNCPNASPAALVGRSPGVYSLMAVIVSGAGYPAPSGGAVTPGMGFPVNRRKADDPCRAHAMGGVGPWWFFFVRDHNSGFAKASSPHRVGRARPLWLLSRAHPAPNRRHPSAIVGPKEHDHAGQSATGAALSTH